MNNPYALANPISVFLNKPKEDFTREDLLKVIEKNHIERITFHYTALDGKLKELQIPLPARSNAEIVLTEGERVDGSSLFKGMVDTGLSDLYIVPVWESAFLNPFIPGSLDFVCRYLTSDGKLAPFTPDNVLLNAYDDLKKKTGLELHTFGELEFYLFYKPEMNLYIPPKQAAYHASSPFVKTSKVLAEMLKEITQIVGLVKYAHSEVGFIDLIESASEEINGRTGEQVEIELLSVPAPEAADSIVISKWLIRNIAAKYGMIATFTPKLEEGIAGTGMHIHNKLKKNGKNVMTDKNGNLSTEAKKLIGGLCDFADSLTAFGNTVASSYLRLVPNQEAPTQVCWSDSNRSAMIRVPLGWSKINNLASVVNRGHKSSPLEIDSMQTVEIRTPDGSANSHLLMAGITAAVGYGFENKESLATTDKLYIKGNIHKDRSLSKDLAKLPSSCAESAKIMRMKRSLYERNGIFPPSVIDYAINALEAENDKELQRHLSELSGKNRAIEIKRIMHKDLHKN